MKYIPAIDGLRAIAILIVLASHFVSEKIPGGFGVTLFFFISGYLITRLLLAEHAASGSIAVLSFYVRRFRRLAPALIAMVLIVTACYWLLGWKTSGAEVSAALLYYMNYYSIVGGDTPLPFGPLWSLAIEEHYYLLYPVLLLFGLQSKRALLIALIASCIAVLCWRVALTISGASDWRIYVGTDTRIDSIIFGAILAVAIDRYGAPPVKFLWAVLAGSIALILASFLIRSPIFRDTLRYTIQGLALAPILYIAMIEPRAAEARRLLLERPIMVWTGKISYSLYLWHFPILVMLKQSSLGPQVAVAVALPLSFLTAAASYYLVEMPIRTRHLRPEASPQ